MPTQNRPRDIYTPRRAIEWVWVDNADEDSRRFYNIPLDGAGGTSASGNGSSSGQVAYDTSGRSGGVGGTVNYPMGYSSFTTHIQGQWEEPPRRQRRPHVLTVGTFDDVEPEDL